MPSTTTDVAMRFVDLVLKYQQWNEVKTLPADEMRVFLETVSAAGFNAGAVVPGKLVGANETFPINSHCPFKVIDQEDHDYRFATGWLNCAFQRVVLDAITLKKSRDQCIKVIASEIERSVPLKPIYLTLAGDMLGEYPPKKNESGDYEYFVDHTRDEHRLDRCSGVGVHRYCNGWMDRHRATERHDAIVCRKCYLRVLFQKECVTYGELRKTLGSS